MFPRLHVELVSAEAPIQARSVSEEAPDGSSSSLTLRVKMETT